MGFLRAGRCRSPAKAGAGSRTNFCRARLAAGLAAGPLLAGLNSGAYEEKAPRAFGAHTVSTKCNQVVFYIHVHACYIVTY